MTARPAAIVAVVGIALAGVAAAQDAGWEQTAPLPAYMEQDAPPPGSLFKEMDCYGPVVKRSFVPATVPAVTPRFLNPRTYPYSIGAFNRPFLFDHQSVWYPGYLPVNYDNTAAPHGSFALAYLRGETGVTANLSRGYPEGQRVVEPVLVPYAQGCRRRGVFLSLIHI
ncbi:MAG: hypothetical protein N2111_07885, partial [Candidatus Sumerlaeaceae bacterium]|nr:hypothetical protein [Candidatus Sumerlaeaceae bacterium]